MNRNFYILLFFVSFNLYSQKTVSATDLKREIIYSNQSYNFISSWSLSNKIEKKYSIQKENFIQEKIKGKDYLIKETKVLLSNKKNVLIKKENKLYSKILEIQLENSEHFYVVFNSPVLIKFIGHTQNRLYNELIFEITIKKKKFIVGFSKYRTAFRIEHYDFY
ncbi:MAG: hypothetical protein V4548_09200 [Bacteroidota bacterium]